MKSKVAIVLVLLLVAVCLLAGCNSGLKKGAFGHHYMGPCFEIYSMYAGVKSNTDTFAIDNVTFDLYYGLYNLDEKEEFTKHYIPHDGYNDLFFAIYVSEQSNTLGVPREIDDYRNIENVYFIKEISLEEALTQDYGYEMSKLFGLKYNHHEEISVPQEVFNPDEVKFVISVYVVTTSTQQDLPHRFARGYYVELRYKFIDNNTIEIN